MADEEAKQKEALNATLKEYISEWRATREKEEEELKKLKEKQAKRKEIRAEQEKKLNQAKKEEEEKLRKEEADKRAAEAEEKKKRLEEAEAKRQEMLDAQKADKAGAASKKSTAGTEGNDARKEMTKTKEQLEEEKKIALSIRIKPLQLDAMDTDDLKAKATELFNIVIQLETDKYDYEQKRVNQERSRPRCRRGSFAVSWQSLCSTKSTINGTKSLCTSTSMRMQHGPTNDTPSFTAQRFPRLSPNSSSRRTRLKGIPAR